MLFEITVLLFGGFLGFFIANKVVKTKDSSIVFLAGVFLTVIFSIVFGVFIGHFLHQIVDFVSAIS